MFTLNRVPSKAVEKTPHEMWTGNKHALSFLKIWGCEASVKRLQSDKSDTVILWVTQGKLWATTSITMKRAKYLSLEVVSSLRKSFSISIGEEVRSELKSMDDN